MRCPHNLAPFPINSFPSRDAARVSFLLHPLHPSSFFVPSPYKKDSVVDSLGSIRMPSYNKHVDHRLLHAYALTYS